MIIAFINEGTLSPIDLTTMGDSSKRGDVTKIGKYDSGLKYALCILQRLKIGVNIYSGGNSYFFKTKTITDGVKQKDVLSIIHEDINFDTKNLDTGFAINLGADWENWMAFRELYSNCLDEGGSVHYFDNWSTYDIYTDDMSIHNTIIVLDDVDNIFKDVVDNFNNYFINDGITEVLYENSNIKIYPNHTDHLILFKNGIRVYEDVDTPSRYIYDYSSASIDEMRVLNDMQEFKRVLSNCIANCNDGAFISEILRTYSSKDFINTLSFYEYDFSKVFINYVNMSGKINTYPNIWEALLKNHTVDVGMRKVTVNPQSYFWEEVTVTEVSNTLTGILQETLFENKELTFEEKILEICYTFNFKPKYPIIRSEIKGYTCVSDTYHKCIYVTDGFCKDTMWEMIKAHSRLESDDADYIYKQYVKLLK